MRVGITCKRTVITFNVSVGDAFCNGEPKSPPLQVGAWPPGQKYNAWKKSMDR